MGNESDRRTAGRWRRMRYTTTTPRASLHAHEVSSAGPVPVWYSRYTKWSAKPSRTSLIVALSAVTALRLHCAIARARCTCISACPNICCSIDRSRPSTSTAGCFNVASDLPTSRHACVQVGRHACWWFMHPSACETWGGFVRSLSQYRERDQCPRSSRTPCSCVRLGSAPEVICPFPFSPSTATQRPSVSVTHHPQPRPSR